MKKYTLILLGAIYLSSLGFAAVAPTVGAVDIWKSCTGNNQSVVCGNKTDNAQTMVQPIVSIMLTILGAISVIMIVIGGIMYTLSAGEPGKTKKAKDTVLYSVIGLVVAILAYGIVEFVVKRVV